MEHTTDTDAKKVEDTDAKNRAEKIAIAEKMKADKEASDNPEDKNWELPEGTTRETLSDGSIVYTLPDGTQRHDHLGMPPRYIFKPRPVDKLTVKELADLIRHDVDPNFSQKVNPDERHLHATAVEVTKELGMEPDALNVDHVSGLIGPHVHAPSREFPKMKYNQDRRLEAVVNNEREETDLGPGWGDRHWSAPAEEGDAAPRSYGRQSLAQGSVYPKTKYRNAEQRFVKNQKEEEALGPGWSDHA